MKTIKMNHGYECIVDDDDFDSLSRKKWYRNNYGYAVRFDGRKCISMHREIVGAPKSLEVDHKDRNRLNNQKENLRLCTKTENQGNRNGSRKSGMKGTRFHRRDNRWEAYITISGKGRYLGRFQNEIDAARAYNLAAEKHFGAFALLNPVA